MVPFALALQVRVCRYRFPPYRRLKDTGGSGAGGLGYRFTCFQLLPSLYALALLFPPKLSSHSLYKHSYC
jgi:hypothetical protein